MSVAPGQDPLHVPPRGAGSGRGRVGGGLPVVRSRCGFLALPCVGCCCVNSSPALVNRASVCTHTCSPPCSSFRQELPPSLYPSIHLSVCPSAAWLQPEFASPSLSNSSSHQDLSHDPLHACSQEEWGWRDLTPSAPWERLFWTPGFQAATSTWLSCPRVQGCREQPAPGLKLDLVAQRKPSPSLPPC